MLKTSSVTCAVIWVALAVSPALAQETGQLKIRFEYGGGPVDLAAVTVNKDVAFCGKSVVPDERLLVNGENKGVKNVVLYVYTRGDGEFDVPAANRTLTLANDKCRFQPHVVIAQTGDKLRVTNPDEVTHNANLQFIVNNAQNFTIPPGQEKTVDLVSKEPAPIPVECNIHPWMKAYVVVLDHPYAGLSDDNGDLTIDNLPVGKTLTFRVNHEVGSFKGVTVAGQEISRRNTFDIEIKSGVNDLGTIVMPAVEPLN